MKTSIVILNWNTLDLLKKCVNSIKKHTKDYEIIIIDNGSNEKGTKEFISKSTDKFIFNNYNVGFAKGNNQGARISEGDFICFLNSDTEVTEGWLEHMKAIFNRDPFCGGVGALGNPKLFSVGENQYSYQQHIGQYVVDTLVDNLIGFCILMKKELFEEIGGWDEDFGTGNYEDTYMSNVIRRKGYNLWVSSKALVEHRRPSRTFDKNKINYFNSLNKNKELFKKKMEALWQE